MMTRRCAMYMRYSSLLQRGASIEDQERRSRELVELQAWTVVEDWVVADRAKSGTSVAGRGGLLKLIEASNLPDLLRIIDTLRFHGVDIVSVAEDLDSAQTEESDSTPGVLPEEGGKR